MRMKYFYLSLFLITFLSCSKSDSSNNCNFLLNAGVDADIDLNLPFFSELQFISNSKYIPDQGNGGIIVINVGNGVLRAWDASDPNHSPSPCSTLEIVGADGVCGCEDANKYSLFTGQAIEAALGCGLKEYRVSATGANSFSITN